MFFGRKKHCPVQNSVILKTDFILENFVKKKGLPRTKVDSTTADCLV